MNELLFSINKSNVEWTSVILPIGISFLTFQKISYLIDVYRKDCEPQRVFIDYLLFIILFPHSIAGPIVRYKEFKEQLTNRFHLINKTNIYLGLCQFIVGLSKKVLIANTLALQANLSFDNLTSLSFFSAWLGIICYTFQIYFDFSGYSDMAIGLGKMLGFKIPENFNFPYSSKSITEFWKRWHITLGSWMKDYLYIPLGGNKINAKRTYINLFMVFLFSGMWHGASWNFIIWGAYHGFFLIAERLILSKWLSKIGSFSVIYNFIVVAIGWVFFRIEHLVSAIEYIKILFVPEAIDLIEINNLSFHLIFIFFIAIFFSFLPQKLQKNFNSIYAKIPNNSLLNIGAFIVVLFSYLICIGELFATGFNPFIYFKF